MDWEKRIGRTARKLCLCHEASTEAKFKCPSCKAIEKALFKEYQRGLTDGVLHNAGNHGRSLN